MKSATKLLLAGGMAAWFALLAPNVSAQIPQTVSFQGVLSDGIARLQGLHTITVRLYDDPTSQSPVWLEQHEVDIEGGLFTVILGSSTPFALPFNRPYWIGVSVDNKPETERIAFSTAPYAFFAKQAQSLSPDATGVVTSVNAMSGKISLAGENGINISNNGGIVRVGLAADAQLKISPTGAAGGDLTGNYPNPAIVNGAITNAKIAAGAITDAHISNDAGIRYGKLNLNNSIISPDITDGAITDAKVAFGISYGKLSGAPAALPPIGFAGGDLSGTYPNPTVAAGAITLQKISQTGATVGQVITFNGSSIVWSNPNLSGAAGGDLTGNYPNPAIDNGAITNAKIAAGAISDGNIANTAAIAYGKLNLANSIVANDLTSGAVTLPKISTTGASAGQTLLFNGTTLSWGTAATSGSAGGDLTGNYPNPAIANGVISNGNIANTAAIAYGKLNLANSIVANDLTSGAVTLPKISTTGASAGQTLLFNGTALSWGTAATSGAAGGDLTGNYPNPAIANGAVTSSKIAVGAISDGNIANTAAIAYGKLNLANSIVANDLTSGAVTLPKISTTGATAGQTLLFNGTALSWGTAAISGSAGGDLTGNYPNPAIANGSVTSAKIAAGAISDGNISNTAAIAYGKLDLANSIVANDLTSGAVTLPKISTTGASAGQTLLFNGTALSWGTAAMSGAAGGDLTGNYPNPTLANGSVTSAKIAAGAISDGNIANTAAIAYGKLNLANSIIANDLTSGAVTLPKISTTGASAGQTLLFNGTALSWGTAAISGSAGGDLTGNYPNPAIANGSVTSAKIAAGAISDGNISNTAAIAYGKLDLANSIVANDLTSGAVTLPKISTTGASAGQTLLFNGTALSWGTAAMSGAAGGDLTGNYPNPTLANGSVTSAKIAAGAISDGNIANTAAIAYGKLNLANSIIANDLTSGAVTLPKISTTGASAGQTLLFNGTALSWGTAATSGSAGGDLTGNYPNPAIANGAVTNAKIAAGAISDGNIANTAAIAYGKLNLTNSIVANDLTSGAVTLPKISTTGASAGQTLLFNGTALGWGAAAMSGAAGGDLTGNYPNPAIANGAVTSSKIAVGAISDGNIANTAAIAYGKLNLANSIVANDLTSGAVTLPKISTTGATAGQTLLFNGTALSWGTAATSGSAGGDLTGNYPNPAIANGAVTNAKIAAGAISDGNIANTAAIAYGKLNLTNSIVANDLTSGAVTLPKISTTGASAGQTLLFNGTALGWGAAAMSGAAGGDLTGNYPNPAIANGAVTSAKIAAGAISDGNIANTAAIAYGKLNLVNSIIANDLTSGAVTLPKISTTGASAGQTLLFNGTALSWGTAAISGSAGGDLTGNYPNPTLANGVISNGNISNTAAIAYGKLNLANSIVANDLTSGAVTLPKISTTGASAGQTLLFNGTALSWGTAATSGSAGGDLTGNYPNPAIANGAVTSSKIAVGAISDGNIANAAAIAYGKLNLANSIIANDLTSGAVTLPKISTTGASAGQTLLFNGTALSWGTAATSGSAGGDLTGNYPNPAIANGAVTNAKIAAGAGIAYAKLNLNNSIVASDLTTGAVSMPKISTFGASAGQAVAYNGTAVAWSNPTPGGNAGGMLTGTYPNPSVAAGAISNTHIAAGAGIAYAKLDLNNSIVASDLTTGAVSLPKISTFGASPGQAVMYNGTAIAWSNPTPGGNAGGMLTGTYPNPSVAAGAISNMHIAAGAGIAYAKLDLNNSIVASDLTTGAVSMPKISTFGASAGQVITYNGAAVAWTTPALSGSAGGDLTGNYPNPTIANGVISNGNISNTAAIAYSKLNLANSIVPGDLTANAVTTVKIADGNVTMVKIAQAGAATSQVIKWNGTAWAPANDVGGLANFNESVNTAAPNNGIPVVQLTPNHGNATVDIALTPKGQGALMMQIPDNTAAGGNKRGVAAIDWQMSRNAATQAATGAYSHIGGGQNNTASANYSTVGGGTNNNASNVQSTIGGGVDNIASGLYSVVGGGFNNKATNASSFTGGGYNNLSSGSWATASGGHTNTASANFSTVAGGSANTASAQFSFVGGGYSNTANGTYAAIAGGYNNVATGDYTAVAGGAGMAFDVNAPRSLGFNGNSAALDRPITVSTPNTAVLANVNLWLANTNNTAAELRLYEAQNSIPAFPAAATNYTAFKAAGQSADITYVLPAVQGGANSILKNDGSGNLSWTAQSSMANFTESVNSAAPNTSTPVVQLLAANAATNVDIALTPKGSGAITAQIADNTSSGGNKRGTNAVDWQTLRSFASHVASGITSVVAGGYQNTASGNNSAVGGGNANAATSTAAVVAGGNSNLASGSQSTVGGGNGNTASGQHSTVSGGFSNTASNTFTTIAGGSGNAVISSYATVGGGANNGGQNSYATVAGGRSNVASGVGSFVGGGGDNGVSPSGNSAGGVVAVVTGGFGNSCAGDYAAILGGRGLTLSSSAARSVGFHANNSAGSLPMTIDAPDVAVFGNTNIWIANNDNSPGELRFYEAQNSSGSFPAATTNYTAFKAASQSADITYTLPAAAPASNGQVLSSTTGGTLSWATKTLKASGSANFGTIPAQDVVTMTVAVTGAAVGDVVYASPAAALPAGIVVAAARVSAADVVSITLANITAAGVAANVTFDIGLIK